VTGMEHSPTSATGTGSERTPWHATQRAAWEASDESNARDLNIVSHTRDQHGRRAVRTGTSDLTHVETS
jgi:hypothetical protein